MNERTHVLLKSLGVTRLKTGEVEQIVTPGTTHTIRTVAAVVSAIGTTFDVRTNGTLTIVTVIEGAVLVKNRYGSVVVKSSEQTQVRKGHAPTLQVPVVTTAVTAWTTLIPGPVRPVGNNVALDANGGSVYGASSQRASTSHTFDAANAVDGRLDRGWQSSTGAVKDQFLKLGFQGRREYTIDSVLLDCSATGGQAQTNALKDFTIALSSTTTDDAAFHPILSATCEPRKGIQIFPLSPPTQAVYVELQAKNNWGGKAGIAVAEMEVISPDGPQTLGTPTPETATPSVNPIVSPTLTPTITRTSVAHSTLTPSATPRPGPSVTVSAT